MVLMDLCDTLNIRETQHISSWNVTLSEHCGLPEIHILELGIALHFQLFYAFLDSGKDAF